MACANFRTDANHRIVIQSMNNSADAYGGEAVTWQTQSTVWAAITPLSGNEVFRQDQNQSMVKTKMTVRYQSALKDTSDVGAYRVLYDGRIFPVKYVTNYADDMKNEGKSFQVLYCQENEASEQ